ncbi:hypothetical protein EJB05_46749, partial [Eragrostis curvula]
MEACEMDWRPIPALPLEDLLPDLSVEEQGGEFDVVKSFMESTVHFKGETNQFKSRKLRCTTDNLLAGLSARTSQFQSQKLRRTTCHHPAALFGQFYTEFPSWKYAPSSKNRLEGTEGAAHSVVATWTFCTQRVAVSLSVETTRIGWCNNSFLGAIMGVGSHSKCLLGRPTSTIFKRNKSVMII